MGAIPDHQCHGDRGNSLNDREQRSIVEIRAIVHEGNAVFFPHTASELCFPLHKAGLFLPRLNTPVENPLREPGLLASSCNRDGVLLSNNC